VAEVRRALEEMGLDGGAVRQVVAELEGAGLLDDRRFAREYVRTKLERRGLGPHRLRWELRKLGVRGSLVEEVLQENFGGEAQEQIARRLAEKKLGTGPVDEKAVRRVVGMLERRGFDFEVVRTVAFELLRRRLDPEQEPE